VIFFVYADPPTMSVQTSPGSALETPDTASLTHA